MSKLYSVLDLVQGSDAWKNARFDYLTASQAPVLFDLSPYQTRLQLFEEKVYRKEASVSESKQILFEIGHKAEQAGREWLKANQGIEMPPAVLVSLSHPDLLASLDGFNEAKNVIFESKYVGRDALFDVKKGKLKAHHECQVQAQLLVSGAEKCIYFALDPNGDAAIIDVHPNLDFQKEIAEAATKFMKDLREGTEPEPSMRDFYCPEDPRFEQLRILKETADMASAAFDSFKKELAEQYKEHSRIRAGGLSITRSLRKGNVNYSKIPQLKGVDLEKYRGKSIELVTVRLDKKESA